jgi:plasmid stability protein
MGRYDQSIELAYSDNILFPCKTRYRERMTNLPPSRTADRIIIRLPDGMRERLKRRADANGHSMTAEVVAILSYMLGDAELDELDKLRVQLVMANERAKASAQQLEAHEEERRRLLREVAAREAMLARKSGIK